MPLTPSTLADGLEGIGQYKTKLQTAQAWLDAWFSYAQDSIVLTPGGGGKTVVASGFISSMLNAFDPGPPDTFFTSLGLAMAAGWLSLGTPASLLPTYLAIIPPTTPLSVAVSATKDKKAACQKMASSIHLWTITAMVTLKPPPPAPPIPLS